MATIPTPQKKEPKHPGSLKNIRKEAQLKQERHARPRGPKPGGVDWTVVYLEQLTTTGYQVKSAEAAGVDFTTVYRRRLNDPDFLAREAAALKCVQALFEDELKRRAVNGSVSTTYDKDGNVKSERIEYSDTLMLRWLERRDPSWRSKQEIEHSGGVQIGTRAERLKALEAARAAAQASLS